jgi:hypothetical protein
MVLMMLNGEEEERAADCPIQGFQKRQTTTYSP